MSHIERYDDWINEESTLMDTVSGIQKVRNVMAPGYILMVKLKTKDNYKNVNFKELEVYELLGNGISVYCPKNGFSEDGEPLGEISELTAVDFALSDIVSLYCKEQ